MKAKIITIGDEILIGQITDTNSAYIAGRLTDIGIRVEEMESISDRSGHITATLDRDCGHFDLLVFTGGLGPTKDDLTKQTLTRWLGDELLENAEALEAIKAFFSARGIELTKVNREQALLPASCTPLPNSAGTAPGMWFEKNGSILVFLPGVPFEMKALMEEQLLPRLRERVTLPQIQHRTIMTQGIPESILSDMLENWETSLPEGLSLAYLPRPGIVRLRLTARGLEPELAKQLLEVEIAKLFNIIPKHIFGFDEIQLEEALGKLLSEKKLTLASAESCTGGAIAQSITSVPGASAYFKGSVVAYSNSVKTDILGVPMEILAEHGAVSQQTVEYMARSVRKLLDSDLGVAVSGIAGPSGGTDEKPVGTTWIAVASATQCYSKRFLFGEHRGRNIERARLSALELTRQLVNGILE